MGVFKTTERKNRHPVKNTRYLVKRCPECFINLPIDAEQCHSCKTRVSDVDRHGRARKKTNWYSYVTCIVAWGAFILYIRWAFF